MTSSVRTSKVYFTDIFRKILEDIEIEKAAAPPCAVPTQARAMTAVQMARLERQALRENLKDLPKSLRKQAIKDYREGLKFAGESGKAALARTGLTRQQMLERLAEGRVKAQELTSTHLIHAKKVDGKWVYSKERHDLHSKLGEKMVRAEHIPAAGEQPVLLMTGGYPGSGKSSMLDRPEYKERIKKFVHLDSDEVKKALAAADGISELGFRASAYHFEADQPLEWAMNKAKRKRANVLFDGTMKSEKKVQRMVEEFKAIGYRVEMAYADLPMEKTIHRGLARFATKAGDGSGRLVDPSYIVTHDSKNIKTFNALKDKVDDWVHWNTDVPQGTLATKVAESRKR